MGILTAQESFTSGIPNDITYGSGVSLDSGVGNPTPSIKSSGSGGTYWWAFNRGSRFDVTGDFDYSIDLYLASGGRDICNVLFWGDAATTSVNGFCFRVQNSSSDGGFFIVTGGSHSAIGSPTSVVSPDTWYTVRLQATGNIVTATVTQISDSSVLVNYSLDLTSYLDGSHLTEGIFGQKADGAGTVDYWDNAILYTPGSLIGPFPTFLRI